MYYRAVRAIVETLSICQMVPFFHTFSRARIRSVFDGFRNFGSEQQRGSNGASSSNGGSGSTSRGKKRTLEELFKPPLDIMFKGDLQVRYFMRFLSTLEHTNSNKS